MNRVFTLACRMLFPALLFLCAFNTTQAQITDTLELGRYYTALAKDAANNIYVTRYNAGTNKYDVVKYANGAGTATVIHDSLAFDAFDYPWGLAVAANGDVYIAASNIDNKVIRLTYNSALNSYTPSNLLQGHYYSALAIDAGNNLYTTEYDGSSHYAVVKYAPGSTTGTTLYGNLYMASGAQYPTGLAVAANGDVYVTDGFNSNTGNNGHVYKLTAASSYALSTISSGKFSTAVALDPAGNLYCSEYNGTTYVLNKYTGGSGTPTALATLLSVVDFYPWGIAALNAQNIFYANGNSSSGNNTALLQLLSVPPTQATGIAFTNTTATGTTASWARGSGSGCIVFIAQASSGNPAPVNNTTYTANAAYTSGTQIGATGWYCVYKGLGTSVNITGLTAGNTYRVKVMELNGSGGNEQYNTTTGSNVANVLANNPLPVTVSSFSGQYREGKVYLSWETQSEHNNKQFRVQWSLTGKESWTDIGAVATNADQGNSNNKLSYAFVYDKPGNGLNLFRLLQEDLDGTITVSNTVPVMVAGDDAALTLSPNPVRNRFTIAAPFLPGAAIDIVNAAGKIMRQEKADSKEVNIDIAALPAGSYWIKIVNGATTAVRKIVKE